MRAGGADTIGVEERHAEFSNGFRGKSDAALYTGEKRQAGGFPKALIIDGSIERGGANFANGFYKRRHGTRFGGPYFGGQTAALNQRFVTRVSKPDNF
jgi:hypothetical protein